MDFTFRHIETVDSTNAYLQRMQGTNEINGFVVSADEQTAGKGMGSNSWESAKGMNLTFSLAIDMSWLPAAEQFMLSQIVPLGIIEVLDKYLPTGKLQIKWPNDIYFDERKLGGILISSTIKGNHLSNSIIGIGLNVNQTQFMDWPTRPISMKMITGKDYDLESLLKEMVAHVGELVEEVRRHVISGLQIRNSGLSDCKSERTIGTRLSDCKSERTTETRLSDCKSERTTLQIRNSGLSDCKSERTTGTRLSDCKSERTARTTKAHVMPTEEQGRASMGFSELRNSINNRYYARLFRYHEWGEYEANGQKLHLFMTGIDQFGRLQLIDEAQNKYCFDIKEIRFASFSLSSQPQTTQQRTQKPE